MMLAVVEEARGDRRLRRWSFTHNGTIVGDETESFLPFLNAAHFPPSLTYYIWQYEQGEEIQNHLTRSAAILGYLDEPAQHQEDANAEAVPDWLYKTPDLGMYFSQFDWLEEKQIVTLCRSYASYISNRAKPRK